MGAWGTKPFENDAALDWMSFIERPILREITFALTVCDDSGYHEAIAAAALLVQMTEPKSLPDLSYYALQDDTFDQAINALKRIQSDGDWINGWTTPRSVRLQLRKLIACLAKRRDNQLEHEKKMRSRILFKGSRRLIARTSVNRKPRAKAKKSAKTK